MLRVNSGQAGQQLMRLNGGGVRLPRIFTTGLLNSLKMAGGVATSAAIIGTINLVGFAITITTNTHKVWLPPHAIAISPAPWLPCALVLALVPKLKMQLARKINFAGFAGLTREPCCAGDRSARDWGLCCLSDGNFSARCGRTACCNFNCVRQVRHIATDRMRCHTPAGNARHCIIAITSTPSVELAPLPSHVLFDASRGS